MIVRWLQIVIPFAESFSLKFSIELMMDTWTTLPSRSHLWRNCGRACSLYQTDHLMKQKSLTKRNVVYADSTDDFRVCHSGFWPECGRRWRTKKLGSIEGLTEYQLDNGLKVVIFPEPSKDKITVNMTILVGSRHEGYGEAGMAHLLEHMLFKPTPGHPRPDQELQARGADYNGTTWVDRTNYYETLPAGDDNLEWAIGYEADRLVNCPIKAEDLASEMTVVRNEFEMGENNAKGVLEQRMFATAYEWHNYGKSTIGNRADIERVPVENLRDFYKKFYRPDNAVLFIGGRLDEAKTLSLVEKYFGPIVRPVEKIRATYTEEPAQDGERLVTLRRVGNVAVAGVVYHITAASD